MNSTPKSIEAARKTAATCKAKCLDRIGQVGTLAIAIPLAYRRWLRTLESEGLIVCRDGKWYTK